MGFSGKSISRELPKNWRITDVTIDNISFNQYGTVVYSGSVLIQSPKNYYRIIFPPGKGRGYVEKI
ncbi:hypothetical protein [Ornithinibacillus halophilus]|uniref:hypothetical protein n=1 Tax=Ornithinibacillus halophilus TaxID=930117 RepID=UPI000933E939|nr:hypothetical protein [Ornithinibacillus halophilus]